MALAALPVALLADRVQPREEHRRDGRWRGAWRRSRACSRAATAPLFAARAVVGVGEAGYGSVGAALIASVLSGAHALARCWSAFFAAASVGSVLGVLLGGVIAARWGWKAAFGVVGVPGLLLALLYLYVRDYRTVDLTPPARRATRTRWAMR